MAMWIMPGKHVSVHVDRGANSFVKTFVILYGHTCCEEWSRQACTVKNICYVVAGILVS